MSKKKDFSADLDQILRPRKSGPIMIYGQGTYTQSLATKVRPFHRLSDPSAVVAEFIRTSTPMNATREAQLACKFPRAFP